MIISILDYNKDTDSDWEVIAQHNPYWGVITNNKYLTKNLSVEILNEFFESGKQYVTELVDFWNGFGQDKLSAVLDFGAGVGRLLIPMAEHAITAVGIEISESMTMELITNVRKKNIENIRVYKTIEEMLEKSTDKMFDWVNSYIVFQHISPETGYSLMDKLMSTLKIGGYFSLHFNIFSTISMSPNKAIYQQIDSRTISILNIESETSYGDIQMYNYDINKIYYLLLKHGISNFSCFPEDHGGNHTLRLVGRRNKYTLLPPNTNHVFLRNSNIFSQAIVKICGFSGAEDWGTWTNSKEAIVTFYMKSELCGKDLLMRLVLRAFLAKTGEQSFIVYANTKKVADFKINNPEDTEYKIKIPPEITRGDMHLELLFVVDCPTAPNELRASNDTRKLGIGLIEMNITPC